MRWVHKPARLTLVNAVLLALTLLLSLAVFGQSWQSASQSYPLGDTPIRRILVADINGNRLPAVLAVNNTGLLMLAGDGKGNLLAPATTLRPNVIDAAVGNFTGRHHQDVIVIGADDTGGNVGVYLLPNTGKGSLASAVAISLSALPVFDSSCRIAAGTFTNSDHLDIALICGSAPQQIQLGANDGSGNFTFTSIAGPVGRSVQDVAAGDFDGDGFSDLIVTSRGQDNGLRRDVLWNTAGNGFTAQTGIFPADSGSSIIAADYDGDSFADALVLTGGVITPYKSQGPARQFTAGSPISAPGCSIEVFGVAVLQNLISGVRAGDIIAGEQCGSNWQLQVLHNMSAVQIAITAVPKFKTARYLATLTIQAKQVYGQGVPSGSQILAANGKKKPAVHLANGTAKLDVQLKSGMNKVVVAFLGDSGWAAAIKVLHIKNKNHDNDGLFPPPLPASANFFTQPDKRKQKYLATTDRI